MLGIPDHLWQKGNLNIGIPFHESPDGLVQPTIGKA